MPRKLHTSTEKKKKDSIPQLDSTGDIIQALFKNKVAESKDFIIKAQKAGSLELWDKRNGTSPIAVKGAISSEMGNRSIIMVNLSYKDFSVIQLICGYVKPKDELVSSEQFKRLSTSTIKDKWNEVQEEQRIASGMIL